MVGCAGSSRRQRPRAEGVLIEAEGAAAVTDRTKKPRRNRPIGKANVLGVFAELERATDKCPGLLNIADE